MFQDSRGMLYFSTFGGLSVYDGSRFTNYTKEEGLSTILINDVLEMGDDSLWIVPNSPKLHALVRGKIIDIKTSDGFYPVINKLIKCSDGNYYALADEGLFRFDKNRFTKINLVNLAGNDVGRFFSYAVEINGHLFILTDATINPVNGPGRLIEWDFKSEKVLVTQIIPAFTMVATPEGDLLVSTKHGIEKLDLAALQQDQTRLVSVPEKYKQAKGLYANQMYFDRMQNLWICTLQGIIRIDRQGQKTFFSMSNGLPVNGHLSAYQDKENNIWFINGQTGVSKLINNHFELYPNLNPGFQTSDLYTNEETDSVWFLDIFRNKLLLQTPIESKEFELRGKIFTGPLRLIFFADQELYLCDFSNVYHGQFQKGNIVKLTKVYSIASNRPDKIGINCVLPDGYGNILLCSDSLFVFRKNGHVESFPLGYFADEFAVSSNNRIWVATRSGKIFHFGMHPEKQDHYLQLLKVFDNRWGDFSPRSITTDGEERVWVGSRDHGLMCLYIVGDTIRSWKVLNNKNGLSANYISDLYADDDDNIWAGSSSGVDKVRLDSGHFKIESITGKSNFYQNVFKVRKNKLGQYWILTTSGVIKTSQDTNRKQFQPVVFFREISEGGKRMESNDHPASLIYLQNNLSFSVAAPTFIDEKSIRFSYQLEGSNNKFWSDPSPQALINFINLPPGQYRLKVKAIFQNSPYRDSETSYAFVIHPPWWQTMWFRIVAVLLFVIFCWLLIRSYYRRKLSQQKAALEKQQAVEKERTRIAVDMHDDLGAGLSTIRFLSEKVKRNTFSEVTKEDVEKMQSTSNELIDKMNEIIWAMSEKNDSLEDLVLYMRSYSMEYCEENNLNCSIHLPENLPQKFVSGEMRRNIFLMVKESLHNIVKHAGAQRVDIQIEAAENLDISIQDDGRGFVEQRGNREGNGLRNMRTRIESVGGSLNIQNEQGVRVNLRIPLN